MAKLLVVDDEVGIRELLSEILEDEGHDVLTAANATEARSIVISTPLDLILLDIWMPDMDGVTLLKELAAKRLLHCPVVMMSGHATIDTAVEATKFGACDFLEKPISMQRLLSAVDGALSQSKAAGSKPEEQESRSSAHAALYRSNGTELGTISFALPLRDARDEFEKLYLQNLLEEEGYSMSKVAARSGLERTHLYRKIKQLSITLPQRGRNP
ncbi:MAG: response regulator [Sutterellaceae bacterium]|nr:response regulator [Sutterellaceae bacterium]MDD7442559.1 response regulator [Sutterellaceae bacterium]MDY2867203.1 response regulator [Mesosutterella sp.]